MSSVNASSTDMRSPTVAWGLSAHGSASLPHHRVQSEASSLPVVNTNFPAGQSMHVLDELAATAGEYIPAPQSMQLVAVEDEPARYWPARQPEQLPVSAVGVHAASAYCPSAQVAQVMHAVALDVGPRRYCPTSHSQQAPVFADSVHDVDAFLPAGHVAQGPEQSSVVLPSRPYRPAAHDPVQALEAEPPVPYFPFGQCMHSGAALPEYRPAIHAEQLLALAWENVPATQPLQLVAV